MLRAFGKRKELTRLSVKEDAIYQPGILAFAVMRNEAFRIPRFLKHYRRLGVSHFLVIDNDSSDETSSLLSDEPDISLWRTEASYRSSRFGVDWLTCLLAKFGHNRWCLTIDADELLVYPYWETRPMSALAAHLDQNEIESFGAMMLDMYPKGPINDQTVAPEDDPIDTLSWFDAGNYSLTVQEPMQNLWLQGGPRARSFFGTEPRKSPTLNKIPLVKWNRRFAYVNSTHSLLPARLNGVYAADGSENLCGTILHTKFLPDYPETAMIEKIRGEHFARPDEYASYFDAVSEGPDLWCPASQKFRDWQQLETLGLMSKGSWA